MSTQAAATSVRQTITVDAPQERAFSVFADDLGSWFPREYNLLPVDIAERTLEPRPGGRIYDTGTDGSTCAWGRVVAYEPPERLVFNWAISTQWTPEEDPARMSEVEVRFVPEGPERTRVELEHRHLDRHGEGWEQMRASVETEGGWPYCLQKYAERLAA